MRHRLRRESLNALFIVAGILCAAMGIKGFLLSSSFIDGGVTSRDQPVEVSRQRDR